MSYYMTQTNMLDLIKKATILSNDKTATKEQIHEMNLRITDALSKAINYIDILRVSIDQNTVQTNDSFDILYSI